MEVVTSGLLIERSDREHIPVPLVGVFVQAQLIDLVAEVNIEQRYTNKEKQPIETVYMFSLDEGAALCRFTAVVEDRIIEGVVRAKEETETEYQEAIRSGHTAFMIEKKSPDYFKAKIGNLTAGAEAKIQLTYVTELKMEAGEICFYLPTTIAPSFSLYCDKSREADQQESFNYTLDSHYGMEFNATVQMGSDIKEIRSPTHTIVVRRFATDTTLTKRIIKLKHPTICLDRDLVVYIRVAEPYRPRLLRERSPSNSSAMMLSLVPSFNLLEVKMETIFVIDRSCSMFGPGLEAAKRALILFLHLLPIDCYVNMVGFGTSLQSLFPTSTKCSKETLSLAEQYVDGLCADFGSTEICKLLSWVFDQPEIEGYARQVFVLTGGEVPNMPELMRLLRSRRGGARVFGLGLGSSVSHSLIEGIALAGGGTALFAPLDESLESKVTLLLQDALQPTLSDVKVKWEGYNENAEPLVETGDLPHSQLEKNNLRQAPPCGEIPPVFNEKHLVVYALIAQNAHVPNWVEVIIASPVGPLSFKVFPSSTATEGTVVHRLAANTLIQYLQAKDQEDADAKDEIIQLGCQFGLASRYTSFIAIDKKENEELKDSMTLITSRNVPVQLAYGWGGVDMDRQVVEGQRQPSANRSLAWALHHNMHLREAGAPDVSSEVPSASGVSKKFRQSTSFGRVGEAHIPQSRPKNLETTYSFESLADEDKLITLLSTQSYDGWFGVSDVMARLFNTNVENIKQAGMSNNYSESVWGTALGLAYLILALPKLRNSWLVAANKAEKWIRLQPSVEFEPCLAKAKEFVTLHIH